MKHHTSFLIILTWLVFASANVLAQADKTIGQAEAVKAAEKFVARHGYNRKLKATEPSIYGVASDGSEDGARIKRSKAIQSRAFEAFIKDEDGRRFWSVQFLFRQQQADRKYDFGREVRVSLNGREASMQKASVAIQRRFVDSVEER